MMSEHLNDLKSRCIVRSFRSLEHKVNHITSFEKIPLPLPNGLGKDDNIECPKWYSTWLIERFRELPTQTFDIFHTDHANCQEADHWKDFACAFSGVGESVCLIESITVDGIVESLQKKGLITKEIPTEQAKSSQEIARYFTFCVLGWQAMLFNPAPIEAVVQPPHQLGIQEKEGYCEYTHMALQQETRFCERDTLDEFLMGYGILLPAKNICLNENSDIQRAFHADVELQPKFFNAQSLTSIAGVKVKWVDALACHLEFNSTARELSLFRFPSFCQLCRSTYKSTGRGAIYSYATTSRLRCQWATQDEINDFMLEVLRSYRILFGQTKKSRTLFRSLDPNSKLPQSARDPLLKNLYSRKTCDILLEADKELYYLPQDFPILRYRIIILQQNLKNAAPQTWSQLWRDKRNSANWLTFWAVIFFGAFGSLMAFLQALLQLIQMAKDD